MIYTYVIEATKSVPVRSVCCSGPGRSKVVTRVRFAAMAALELHLELHDGPLLSSSRDRLLGRNRQFDRRGNGCNPSGGDDLVAALAQNGDGLRADQAGAADNDDLHIGLISFSPSGRSRPCRCDNATGPVASAQDFRKASSSAFTSTWWVAVMPCGAPG